MNEFKLPDPLAVTVDEVGDISAGKVIRMRVPTGKGINTLIEKV